MPSASLNTYVYGNKDDEKLRTQWRERLDEEELAQVCSLVDECTANGVAFVFSLSPGLDVDFARLEEEVQAAVDKVAPLVDHGVHTLAVFWDDIEENVDAEAQVAFTNALVQAYPSCTWLFCPTEYCEERAADGDVCASAYLTTLGDKLHPSVHVMWTGPSVISAGITVAHLKRINGVLQRKVLLWDNLFANDYDVYRQYMGAYCMRRGCILDHVAGILVNPNCEYAANHVVVHSLGSFVAQGDTYTPAMALDAALDHWHADLDEAISMEHLRKLVSLFSNPFTLGTWAQSWVHLAQHVFGTYDEDSSDHDQGWQADAQQLIQACNDVIGLFDALTEASGARARDLVYAVYPRVWSVKEEALLLRSHTQWLCNGASGKHRSFDHQPSLYRGGIIRDLQALLDMDASGAFAASSMCRRRAEGAPQGSAFTVRAADPQQDHEGMYRVCLLTGDAGDDGSHLFADDPMVLGHRYVGPYLHLETPFSLALEDSQGVCGYCLATPDSTAFYARYRNEWLPDLRSKYAFTESPSTPSQRVANLFHEMEQYDESLLAEFPAHLHIDLLPRAQGKGNGRRLIEQQLARLCAAGCPGVHLEMAASNTRALAFYQRLGFFVVSRDDEDIIMAQYLQPMDNDTGLTTTTTATTTSSSRDGTAMQPDEGAVVSVDEDTLPVTERRNPLSERLSSSTSQEIVRILRSTDAQMFGGYGGYAGLMDDVQVEALERVGAAIGELVDGGRSDVRVVFAGCGTSGRMAYYCAREANRALVGQGQPPVFRYVHAGGDRALFLSDELPEDDALTAQNELEEVVADMSQYVYVGISCGLSAPYVCGQLEASLDDTRCLVAAALGFNPADKARDSVVQHDFQVTFRQTVLRLTQHPRGVLLNPVIGPEPVAGSTRMKGGSATLCMLQSMVQTALHASPSVLDSLEHLQRVCGRAYAHGSVEAVAVLMDACAATYARDGNVYYAGVGDAAVLAAIDASEMPDTYGLPFEQTRAFVHGGWATVANQNVQQRALFAKDVLTRIDLDDMANDVQLQSHDTVLIVLMVQELAHLPADSVDTLNALAARCRQVDGVAVHILAVQEQGKASLSEMGLDMDLVHSCALLTVPTCTSAINTASLAFKVALNAVSTGAQVQQGVVYRNVMVNVGLNNNKLYWRAVRVVASTCDVSVHEAEDHVLAVIFGSADAVDRSTSVLQRIELATAVDKVVPCAIMLATGRAQSVAQARELLTQGVAAIVDKKF